MISVGQITAAITIDLNRMAIHSNIILGGRQNDLNFLDLYIFFLFMNNFNPEIRLIGAKKKSLVSRANRQPIFGGYLVSFAMKDPGWIESRVAV